MNVNVLVLVLVNDPHVNVFVLVNVHDLRSSVSP